MSLSWDSMPADDPSQTFGRRLRAARGKLSQSQLATAAGISKRSVASYEAGETLPSIDIAARLAEALGVTLDELAGVSRLEPQQQPRQVVLLIDGEPWIAHAERRTESRDRLAQALEDAQAFEASRDPQVRPRDRRRRTR
jgi:transcriptional regulator with XRE-family HTH domain